MLYAHIQTHLMSVLIALAVVPLALYSNAVVAAGAAILAVVAFLHTRNLLEKVKKASPTIPQSAEGACGSQVFASVDELSAGIAHEINNPLAIIAQETEWLLHLFESHTLEDLRQTDDCKDCLREISNQVDRCKEIVKKLLSLARQMKPVIQVVNVNNILRTIIDLAQREASEKSIKIVGQLDPDLPPMSSDPPLLRQVFLNLLVNATQAIDKAGTVIVTSKKLGEESVEITVWDSGCGISPENIGKVFRPFFSTKPEGKGTGLGLAICRGIVERLGGSISVASDPGTCTVFSVRLPVHYAGREGEKLNEPQT